MDLGEKHQAHVHNGWAEPVSSILDKQMLNKLPLHKARHATHKGSLTSLTQDYSAATESISIVLYVKKSKCYVFIYL